MAVTKQYFERLIDQFYRLCHLSPDDPSSLEILKKEINQTLSAVGKYGLFETELDNTFFQKLIEPAQEVRMNRNLLAEQIYKMLGRLVYSFERATMDKNYSIPLEKARTALPFEDTIQWHWEIPEKFSSRNFYFQFNQRQLLINSKAAYLDYQEQMKLESMPTLGVSAEAVIPSKIYTGIVNYFDRLITQYRKYIQNNYAPIASEFEGYTAQINIYLIPQKHPDGAILIQINQYNGSGDQALHIHPWYVDLLYRFHNAEEFAFYPNQSLIAAIQEHFPEEFDLLFTEEHIHVQLNSIYLARASEELLKEYAYYLLKARGFEIEPTERKQVVQLQNERETLLCFIFLSAVPSLDKLGLALEQQSPLKLTHVLFRVHPDRETEELLRTLSIKPFILEELGKRQVYIGNGELIHLYIKQRIPQLPHAGNTDYERGMALLNRLDNCIPGIDGWSQYESLCIDACEYLFKDHFRHYSPRIQSYTSDGIFRRDLVINNNFNDPTSFWAQIKQEFSGNIIVVDFKNYSDPLKQNDFYLTSKYLSQTSGKCGIIFSRKGLDHSAGILQRRLLKEEILLLCLDDEDMIGMIKEKMIGHDCLYRLENLKFRLYDVS